MDIKKHELNPQSISFQFCGIHPNQESHRSDIGLYPCDYVRDAFHNQRTATHCSCAWWERQCSIGLPLQKDEIILQTQRLHQNSQHLLATMKLSQPFCLNVAS